MSDQNTHDQKYLSRGATVPSTEATPTGPKGPLWHGTGLADSYVFDRMLRPDSRDSDDQDGNSDDDDDVLAGKNRPVTDAGAPIFLGLNESASLPPISGGFRAVAAGRRGRRGGAPPPRWGISTTLEDGERTAHFSFDAATRARKAERWSAKLASKRAYVSPEAAQRQRTEELRKLRAAIPGPVALPAALLGRVTARDLTQRSRPPEPSVAEQSAQSLLTILRPTALPPILSEVLDRPALIMVRAAYANQSRRFKLPEPSFAHLCALIEASFGLSPSSDDTGNIFGTSIACGDVVGESEGGTVHSDSVDETYRSHHSSSNLANSGAGLGRHQAVEAPSLGIELRSSDNGCPILDDGSLELAIACARGSVTGALQISVKRRRGGRPAPLAPPPRRHLLGRRWPGVGPRQTPVGSTARQEERIFEAGGGDSSDDDDE